MGRPKKPLRVIPNPYGMVDHNGQPCCAVMCHQGEHVQRGTIRYVGAQIVHAEQVRPPTEIQVGNVTHQLQPADHEIVWEFSTDPVEIPNIPYYVEHITRNGDLIAADRETALACGITQFIEPTKILADARAKAEAEWDAACDETGILHGKGDFKDLEQYRKGVIARKAAEQAPDKPAKATKPAEKGAA